MVVTNGVRFSALTNVTPASLRKDFVGGSGLDASDQDSTIAAQYDDETKDWGLWNSEFVIVHVALRTNMDMQANVSQEPKPQDALRTPRNLYDSLA